MKEDEQFDMEQSGLDIIMAEGDVMESKWSQIVSGESHLVDVQISKDTPWWSNASNDESLTIDSIVRALLPNE
jgi:hypothetical protein